MGSLRRNISGDKREILQKTPDIARIGKERRFWIFREMEYNLYSCSWSKSILGNKIEIFFHLGNFGELGSWEIGISWEI